ncbi:5-oxoprolinase subunit C family protein [Cochleicola gelatinilyticus]|uniref:Carboxyltransferase domain-containing protein n=1 Tax=Cochleicola gelatinilyticus TaxID=1763537 RepID=A0A167HNM8_9FLAO|nr:biotin-dependent carboxyltransferase family protein [Cochleicola gelatinilyticus]OAB78801.1 hypothetical protein ULVI_09475 [Cochleicola gelatinilyticus]
MIKVITSGMYTSIQDNGRFGYRDIGVPISGAMDANSATLANILVGNISTAAVLECTVTGASLLFKKEVKIAITGGNCDAYVDKKQISFNTVISIPEGSTLTLGRITKGLRTYIAVRGGIASEVILGSRCQYKGITSEEKIKKGTILPIASEVSENLDTSIDITHSTLLEAGIISVYRGPEFEELIPSSQKKISEADFIITSESNRMATFLKSNFSFSAPEIITSPVQPGTVQLTPSGQFIVLMRDAQTTGGYARILQLSEIAICHLAQVRPGKSITFKLLE